MPLRTLPGTGRVQVHRGQADKREILSRRRPKETRILLINAIAFS